MEASNESKVKQLNKHFDGSGNSKVSEITDDVLNLKLGPCCFCHDEVIKEPSSPYKELENLINNRKDEEATVPYTNEIKKYATLPTVTSSSDIHFIDCEYMLEVSIPILKTYSPFLKRKMFKPEDHKITDEHTERDKFRWIFIPSSDRFDEKVKLNRSNFKAKGELSEGDTVCFVVYVRFQDVHKIIEEVNLVKQALGMMNNHSDLLQAEVQLNATIHNATFYESQYRKVLSMYHNLQTSVHDIRQQQQVLITSAERKTRETMRLQKQYQLSTPPPAAKLSSRSVNCGAALGMEDGTMLNASVSSSQSFGDFRAGNARLYHAIGWYTRAKKTPKNWVQINPKYFKRHYGFGNSGSFSYFTNFVGNSDQTTIKYQTLDPPMVAKYVRINIIDFHKKKNSNSDYIGMRTELYGCPVSV
ncbi:unnamed protein product [Mytilus edulis]|uniref:F5/8 type C domain-containing protein n=1 Tax=Mytilus edulis TaxID=6550 RepID=A0A8S3RX50_MYTED|nr:unnamed protein product [Mytilus edulis]